jgi:hypothetical protein
VSFLLPRLTRPAQPQPAKSKPDLAHLVLPSYDVPDMIVVGGVVVENRGNAAAHNVKIVLEFDDTRAERIRHLQVVSDAEYILLSGGEEKSFATLRMRELPAGKRIVIYFSGPDRLEPRVTVTHYEG